MVWKKGKKRKEKRAQSLQAIGMKILLPVFLALFGLLICLFIGLGETRNVANQYVQDTAELYVEQVNKDILQMNTELIQILVSNDYIAKIPAEIKAEDAQYYHLLRNIRDENRMLKIRYEEVTNFFVYAQEADLLIIVLLSICSVQLFYYFRNLMRPLQSFVQGITELEEEQQLNENGENNILELEAVSDRFRGMLRKIQSLKIAIYEKELNEQKAELEYMQEQIRPHFFLNCLSLIHGIADAQGETTITHITKVLSEYMRYNYQDSGKERNIQEELEHVKKYVELQKLRYGEDGFRFEVIEDAQVGECRVPSLVLQTLVENSIVHAVTLDRMVEISLYITTEIYENGKYLYICVSDTGKGFSREIIEAIEKDLPIIYNGRKHVGLQNIRRRLQLLYGGRASMTIQNMDENYGAIVEIRIPQDISV